MLRAKITAAASIATLLFGLSLPVAAVAQTTIFTTTDFHKDSTLWTNPAYYRNNTVGQLRGMALNITPYEKTGQVGAARLYGSEGTARAGAVKLESPYPYKTAMEHYEALLKKANGGTKHTKATIPDWGGRWDGGPQGLGGGPNPASYVASLLTPKYRETFVQDVKASTEGRTWGPNSFCLPTGFFASLNADEFVVTPEKVYVLGVGNGENYIRWIYTDGVGHAPEQFQYPKWHGESVGFWDGDTLIVHTNQIKGWKGGIYEFSDKLETVEQYRRMGDAIQGEITLYDPEVLVRPLTAKINFKRNKESRPELRPQYNTCTDTNGPSQTVYMDKEGKLNETTVGDANYWDATDPRPWSTWLTESDKRAAQSRRPQAR